MYLTTNVPHDGSSSLHVVLSNNKVQKKLNSLCRASISLNIPRAFHIFSKPCRSSTGDMYASKYGSGELPNSSALPVLAQIPRACSFLLTWNFSPVAPAIPDMVDGPAVDADSLKVSVRGVQLSEQTMQGLCPVPRCW